MLLRTLNQGKTRKKDLLLCTALVCSLVMGSLSGCGVHQQEKYDSASVVADKALEEFMKLAAVPRPLSTLKKRWHISRILLIITALRIIMMITAISGWMFLPRRDMKIIQR